MLENLTVALLVLASAVYSIWRLLPGSARTRLALRMERCFALLARRPVRRVDDSPPRASTSAEQATRSGCDGCSLRH